MEHSPDVGPDEKLDAEISLVAVATTLFRWRWLILTLGFLGASLGLASGLTSTRMYVSSATIVPQDAESSTSNLAAAASQFGIRVGAPASGTTWGPAMYVMLVRTRALLEPIALDTLVVPEKDAQRIAFMDLLRIEGASPEHRLANAVRDLSSMISASEDRRLGTVEISVTSEWASVSTALAQRVVERLNEFNLRTRQSQAAAEREFVEMQAADAERGLREAEGALMSFLQRNRVAMAPELAFRRDRLAQEVTMRQELYSSWLKHREEARIREVRDTPVITVVEPPRYPYEGLARRSVRKGILGGIGGAGIAMILALIVNAYSRALRSPSPRTQEFVQLIRQATPRFLRPRRA